VISSSAPKRKGTNAESCKFGAYVAIFKKSKKIPTEFAGVNIWMNALDLNFSGSFYSAKNKKSDAWLAPL
jgi:hypothetical protein